MSDAPGSDNADLDLIDTVLSLVRDELIHATRKFGPFHSGHEGYAVIKEELEELWAEIKTNRGRSPAANEEAIQVAAMACRYVVDITWPSSQIS